MSLSDTLNVLSPSLTGKVWSGLSRRLVEERRIDGRRLLADDAGERGALGAVALAGRAEAAEQVHLQRGRLGELVGRQLGAALVEVVGDPHRADRVRARRARADLVELVDVVITGPLDFLTTSRSAESGGRGRLRGGGGGMWRSPLSPRSLRRGGGAARRVPHTAPIIALRIMNARRSTPAGALSSPSSAAGREVSRLSFSNAMNPP